MAECKQSRSKGRLLAVCLEHTVVIPQLNILCSSSTKIIHITFFVQCTLVNEHYKHGNNKEEIHLTKKNFCFISLKLFP
jgi:hypothetical protein